MSYFDQVLISLFTLSILTAVLVLISLKSKIITYLALVTNTFIGFLLAFYYLTGFWAYSDSEAYQLMHFFVYSWLLVSPFAISLTGISVMVRKILKKSIEIHYKLDTKSLSRSQFLLISIYYGIHSLTLLPFTITLLSMIFFRSSPKVTQNHIFIKNLGDGFSGYKIVQLSDLHIGPSVGLSHVQSWINRIKKLDHPDLLVITGDLIDSSNSYTEILLYFLESIKKYFSDGIMIVSGNHDYFDNFTFLSNELAEYRYKVLNNESVTIKKGSSSLNFIGFEYASNVPAQIMALKTIKNNSPTIALSHDPSNFEWLKFFRINLVLSGHTHGGHIHFSYGGHSLYPLFFKKKYVAGFYYENEKVLYVNRGLGHSIPLRINSTPEIAVFTLNRKSDA